MSKPEEILEIEKIYGVTIHKFLPNGDTNILCYHLNSNNEIIGLYLSCSEITEITGLEKFTQLKELDLSQNQIVEIKGLENLLQLEKLDLCYNQIKKIEGLEKLTNLQRLWLHGNLISKIEGLEKLTNLIQLHLEDNQIESITTLEENIKNTIGKLKFLQVSGNRFSNPQLEKEGSNLNAVLKYFSDIQQKKIAIKLPAKIMLLGNHGVGKSTFLDYLQNGELPTNKQSTHILKIIPYYSEDAGSGIELPKAIFYDFGGQDYYHGLYRTFFSDESINLLLWRNKTNKNQIRQAEDKTDNYTRDYSAVYWLYQMSDKDPILLIQTHADEERRIRLSDIPVSKFLEGEYYVSLNKEKAENNKVLISSLKYLSEKVNILIDEKRKTPVEKNYYYSFFLQFVFKHSDEKYIRIKEDIFDKDYYGRSVLENETESDLLMYLKEELHELSKTGLVLYYKNNDKLKDIVWLNPEKAVTYIHDKILTKSLLKEYKGIINENDFNRLCIDEEKREHLEEIIEEGRKSYKDSKKSFEEFEEKEREKFKKDNEKEQKNFEIINELLLEQKVIFYDRHEKQYIIPGYLQLSREDNLHENLICEFDEQPDLILKFKYYIPFGLINQFICLYGKPEEVRLKNYWRDELIFVFDVHYRIRIKFDFSRLTIEVYINEFSKKSSLLSLNEIKKWIFFNIIDLYSNGEVCYPSNYKGEQFYDGSLHYNGKVEYPDAKQKEYENKNGKDKFVCQIKEYIQQHKIDTPEDLYISVDGGEYFTQYSNIIEQMNIKKDSITVYPINDETKEIDKDKPTTRNILDYNIFTNNIAINRMKKKIFISYSRKDVDYKDELKKHLNMLNSFDITDNWSCEDISIGTWDSQIQEKLIESDIVIYMLSANFFTSSYILEKEVQNVMEGKSRKKRILCVIVSDFCSLDKIEDYLLITIGKEISNKQQAIFALKRFQFLPYGKVMSPVTHQNEENLMSLKTFSNRNDIETALRQITEKVLEALK